MGKGRLHVVQIVTGLRAGGAERLLVDRAVHSRHEMSVIALANEGVMADRLRELGVSVQCVGMAHNRDLRAVWALAQMLRRLSPDVVHVHLYRSLLFGRISARLAGIRAIIATEHSASPDTTERQPATRAVKGMYRMTERLGKLTVAVSTETRDVLVRHWAVPAERITVIPNGVDVQRLTVTASTRGTARADLDLPSTAKVLVSTARLTWDKHVAAVVDAFAALTAREVDEQLPPMYLLVVGDGDLAQHLRAHARGLRVQDRVRFVGEVENVLPYLAAADAYVSASEHETYGISIVEAYVSGLPVVYRRSPAADDLRRLDQDGRFLQVGPPSGPDVDGLEAAILAALQLPVGVEHVSPLIREQVDVRQVCRRLDDAEAAVAEQCRPTSAARRSAG